MVFFSWSFKKQEVVAQSSAEAEYISAVGATNQAIWLTKILSDLGQVQNQTATIWVDSKSPITMSKSPVQHGRTKYIKVKYMLLEKLKDLKKLS